MIGTADKFPISLHDLPSDRNVADRLHDAQLPWLAEAQPNMFVEIGKELAAEKGIKNGDQVVVSSARGEIQMVAIVTARWKPFKINGKHGPRNRHAVALRLAGAGHRARRPTT